MDISLNLKGKNDWSFPIKGKPKRKPKEKLIIYSGTIYLCLIKFELKY